MPTALLAWKRFLPEAFCAEPCAAAFGTKAFRAGRSLDAQSTTHLAFLVSFADKARAGTMAYRTFAAGARIAHPQESYCLPLIVRQDLAPEVRSVTFGLERVFELLESLFSIFEFARSQARTVSLPS
jgi:hypothetical protein